MKDVIIKIYKDSSVYTENSTLGVNYENIQGKLVFEFVDEFVDGTAYLEFERKFEKGLIPMNKVGKTYEIEIKSSLLKEIGNIELQLRITQDEVPNGIPVYKSKVFTLEVLDAINATSEIPDEYPEWIDLANEKIKEMDNLNVTTERVEDGVDIVLTDKKGNTTRTEVKDGAPGPAGPQGEPGAVKMQVVDTLPETGRTDTIYLVKKDNPGEQNLYDEYVYTDTGWEHIGDTSVDLSNYQEKLTPGDNINIDNNVISATFQKEVIELTDEVITLSQLNPGVYILKPTVKKIKYSSYDADTYLTDHKTHVMLIGTAGTTYNTAYIFSDNSILRLNCYSNGYQKMECSISDMANILSKKNTSTYTPTGDYNPATKKYADDLPTTYTGYDATKTQVLKNINGTLTWVNE